MNKLQVDAGGHPWTMDDLLFVQQNLTDALTGLLSGIGNSLIKISGCETVIGGGNITWTAGWMYVNGEICKVDAGSAAYPANDAWTIVETYDAAGNDTYQDTSVNDTYVLRKAVISGTGANKDRAAKPLTSFLVAPPSLFIPFASIGANGWGSTSDFGVMILVAAFKLNAAKDMIFRGSIEVTSYSAADEVFMQIPWNTSLVGVDNGNDLPLPLPPLEDMYFTLVGSDNGTRTSCYVKIQPNGDCKLIGGVAGHHYVLYLDSLVIPHQSAAI